MSYNPFGIQNIRSLLNENNLFLSKNRGQNYLINRQTAEKIISFLPTLKDNMEYFEVGTGLGALTVILSDMGKTTSLEIDNGVYHLVAQKFRHPNLTLVHADFLKWSEYVPNKQYLFVSNLPYSISGEAIKIFIENPHFSFGVLMLQKEFADRMEAAAGSPNYGPMSVIVQNFLTIKKLLSVGKGNFFPEPKIDSLVISIEKKDTSLNQKEFSQFIKTCFLAKRKTLANNLLNSPWKNSPITKDPICNKRPDAITPEEWMDLFKKH